MGSMVDFEASGRTSAEMLARTLAKRPAEIQLRWEEDSRCKKKKAVHKTATTDDKRVQSTLKRVGVNTI
ncbi:hypothetical protein ZWY2020_045819 [Hordeum vulgare]|nr:hypothetical protein ZWY2020_045819 [Hordeum vulgare]